MSNGLRALVRWSPSRALVSLGALALSSLACGAERREAPPAVPAQAPPATPAEPEKCYSDVTDRRPDGWVVAGSAIVTSRAGHVVSIELRDASGRVVESGALAKDSDLLRTPCKVGGVLGVWDREPALDGASTLTILRPAVEDPAADVVSLCTPPARLPVDSNGGFLWPLARDAYAERLTSKRWRKWLFDLDEHLHADRLTAERGKRAMGDELEAAATAAGLGKSCWMLRYL